MHKLVNGVEVPLTEQEILEYQEREEEHNRQQLLYSMIQYQDDRKREYPPLEEMLVALIEKEEGRPASLNLLMSERQRIKAKYPKPQ